MEVTVNETYALKHSRLINQNFGKMGSKYFKMRALWLVITEFVFFMPEPLVYNHTSLPNKKWKKIKADESIFNC